LQVDVDIQEEGKKIHASNIVRPLCKKFVMHRSRILWVRTRRKQIKNNSTYTEQDKHRKSRTYSR